MARHRAGAAVLVAAGLLALFPPPAAASSSLLYLELQGVAGYSSSARKAVFSSMGDLEAMQKPSFGFDYIQRISGPTRDLAVLAIQARLAYNAGDDAEHRVEPQIYNAYLKVKAGFADVWIGHNRPEFGLAAILDTHGHLLQPLAMSGFGFERDWGVGLEHDYSWGSAGLSMTSGSGMPLAFHGNYFLSARVSGGILEQENYSFGFSAGQGRLLDTMGVHVMSAETIPFTMAGFDVSFLTDAWEHRAEFYAGSRNRKSAVAALWRAGRGFLEENRLRLEIQPAFVIDEGGARILLAAAATWIVHPDWTLRTMLSRDSKTGDVRAIVQVYFYKSLRF